MRLFYALIFFTGITQISLSQSLNLTPVQGNAVLRNNAAKEDLKNQKFLEAREQQQLLRSSIGNCPEEFNFDLVESGEQIFIGIDTFGMGGGVVGDFFAIDECDPLIYGDIKGFAGLDIVYEANDEINNLEPEEGLQTEIICIRFHRENFFLADTVLQFPVTVKRNGTTVTDGIPTINIAPRTVEAFCLPTPSSRFPGAITCSELFNQDDPKYDGESVDGQWQSFTNYSFPDTCLQYGSNRHGGTDRISVVLCDEFDICDTFIVAFEIPIDQIIPDSGDPNLTKVFVDDFSYDGFRPDPDLWLDRQVYKNNTLAVDPPTIGVVTFDGLDHRGEPYDIEFEGVGDILTSKPIDMSGWDEDDNFTFRCFVQRKGLGLAPSFSDSIVLEFKREAINPVTLENDSTEWVYQTGFTGFQSQVSSDSVEAFQFAFIELDDDDYFHPEFQFRFVAVTSPGEAYDNWHVDYVSLDRDNFDDPTFADVAFVNPPTPFLRNYRHMPLNHLINFEEIEILDTLAGVFSNLNDLQPVNLEADETNANYIEIYSGTDFNSNFLIATDGSSNSLIAQEIDTISNSLNQGQVESLENNIQNFSIDDNILIQSIFSYTNPDNNFRASNDLITLNTRLDTIFAHDDGTAESQAFFSNTLGEEEFVQRFHANVDDKITGIQLHFPHVNGDVQDQEFKIRIYVNAPSSDSLIYESDAFNPLYLDNLLFLDTLEGFTTYGLVENEEGDTIDIVGGQDFWVGFVQNSVAELGIPIGFDLQNPINEGDIRYRLNSSNDFINAPNSFLKGSLMMRPIVASGNGFPEDSTAGVNDSQSIEEVMNIYPNPASDKIFVKLLDGQYTNYQISIFNSVGKLMKSQNLEREISLMDVPSGMYFLRIDNLKTRKSYQQKLIITD